MAFHDTALFPPEYSHGTATGVAFDSVIQETKVARSVRIQVSDEPVKRFEVERAVLDQKHLRIGPLLNFARARHGAVHGFRIIDFADFSTAPTHVAQIDSGDLTHRHQFGSGNGTATVFQLAKLYESYGTTTSITIRKPMRISEANQAVEIAHLAAAAQTVWVWIHGTLQTEGVDYTVDWPSGQITFATAPAMGEVLEWAGYFCTPVRFGAEVDKLLRMTAGNYQQRQFDVLTMIEEREDAALLALERDPLGASRLVHTASLQQLSLVDGAVQLHDFDSAGSGDLRLPQEADWMMGGPLLQIVNIGSTANIALKVYGGGSTVIPALAPGELVTCLLAPDAVGTGFDWVTF